MRGTMTKTVFGSIVALMTMAGLVAPVGADLATQTDGVLVSWPAATAPYDVYLDGAVHASDVAGEEHLIEVASLNPGVAYVVEVRDAADTVIETGSFTTSVPDAVSGLSASVSEQTVTATWDQFVPAGEIPEASSYRVALLDDANDEVEVQNPALSAPSAEFTNVAPGTYSVQVQVRNGPDASWLSVAETVGNLEVAAAVTVPSAPQNLVVNGGTNSLVVSWDPPADNGGDAISGYEVTITPTGGGAATSKTTSGLTVTFDDVAAGSYDVEVIARNGVGDSPALSGDGTVDAANAPTAPSSLLLSRDGGEVTASWGVPASNGGAEVTGYRVFIDGELRDSVGPAPRRHTYDLGEGSFEFEVVAENAAGRGAPATATISTTGVRSLSVAPVAAGVTSAELSWTPSPQADSYVVSIGEREINVADGDATGVTLQDLAPGTYTARVVAINDLGRSVAKTSDSFTVTVAPDGPRAVTLSADGLTLTAQWQEPAFNGGSEVNEYVVILVGEPGTVCDPEDLDPGCSITVGSDQFQIQVQVSEPGSYVASRGCPHPGGAWFGRQPANQLRLCARSNLSQLNVHTSSNSTGTFLAARLQQPNKASSRSLISNSGVASAVERFLDTGDYTKRRYITRLYLAYLNRAPDLEGMDYWADLLVGGQATTLDISFGFANSEEFELVYGSLDNDEFIFLVYNNVLARTPDAVGFNYWRNELEAGMLRAEMMLYFSESEEFIANTDNFVDVTLIYQGMLQRSPLGSEMNTWLLALRGSQNRGDVVAQSSPATSTRLA